MVEPDERRPGQRRAGEGEEVLGHVVEQDAHVERTAVDPMSEEEVGPTAGLGHVLAVGPQAVLEPDCGPVPPVGVGRIRPQQRSRVGRGHGRLAGSRYAPFVP